MSTYKHTKAERMAYFGAMQLENTGNALEMEECDASLLKACAQSKRKAADSPIRDFSVAFKKIKKALKKGGCDLFNVTKPSDNIPFTKNIPVPQTTKANTIDTVSASIPDKMQISGHLYLSVSGFNEQHFVHIRSWIQKKHSSELRPTKSGIALSLSAAKTLLGILHNDYDELVSLAKKESSHTRHLGKNIYMMIEGASSILSIKKLNIDPSSGEQIMYGGLSMNMHVTRKLIIAMLALENVYPEFASLKTCGETHDNIEDSLACTVCTPDGFKLF